ncbi:MAG: bifunctional riboflavin kinase/FAD synthetase [Candidatus Omnitrophota bacterium]|nr:MAG: bifunctional riboflavin kinase/FAD synthetase [Candidatus Omnitrophota bacterium]
MKVVYKKLPSNRKKCVATIGVFDGIHLGHQFILRKLKQEAKKHKVNSLLITFDIPPKMILNKNFTGCIMSLPEKKEHIKALKIDYLWLLRTHSSFLKLSGEEFIAYLIKYFKIKKFIVGEDFRFGYRGETDIRHLKKFGQKYDFKVTVLKKKCKDNKIVSSSLIRKFIKIGDFNEANRLLGYNYFLKGRVYRGLGYGRRLGFPTANIDRDGYIIPRLGVYAGLVKVDKKSYLAAVNVGTRPTVTRSSRCVLEVYIIGFNANILGKTITVSFLEKIRNEKKFASLQELKEAISNDVRYIRKNSSLFRQNS